MRILWVDDQLDVARSLSRVIGHLRVKADFAEDGTSAIDALDKRDYDLIIIDLQMPPGEWGGLWLLERLKDVRPSLPALVLSGEGTQRQTIEALRLGARDYVLKEDAATELGPQIQRVLEDDTGRVERHLAADAPSPIAIPYGRFRASQGPIPRLRRALEFYEASLRLTSLIGLAECRSNNSIARISPTKLSSTNLTAPSFGTWEQIRLALLENAPVGPFALFARAFETSLTGKVIAVRNDLAHGSEPSQLVADEILTDLLPGIDGLARRLSSIPGRIVIVQSSRFDGSHHHTDAVLAAGDGTALPTVGFVSKTPAVHDHVYLLSGRLREEGDPLDLHPLVKSKPSRLPGRWDVLVFDGVRGARRNAPLTGDERLRYIDVVSGDRNTDSSGSASALKGFSPDW